MNILNTVIKYIFLAAAGSFCNFILFAQQLDDTIRIREIEITSTLPVEKAVADPMEITRSVIAQQAGTNLTDLLSRHSSVYIRSTGRGTLATAAFRGTDGSHTRIFWNDLEINSAMNGQVDLSLIPVFCLDKIDIYHGGNSLACGSGALGGTLNLASKPDWSGKNGFSLVQELASFHTYNLMFKAGISAGKWYSNTRLFYNYSKNDYKYNNGFVIPARTARIQNGSYNRYGMLQELYCRLNADNLLSFRIWLQHSARNLPPVASYEGNGRIERQDDQSCRATVAWEKYYSRGLVTINSGLSLTGLAYVLRSEKLNYTFYNAESNEFGLFNSVEHKHYLSERTIIRSQLRLNVQQADMYELVNIAGYKGYRHVASLMSSMYRTFGSSTTAWLLIRQEVADRKMLPVMPSAGVEYNIPGNTGLVIKSNISRNFKKPDLNDLYWVPGGNPLLKPEKGLSADLSLAFNNKLGAFDLSLKTGGFYANIYDWILWKPTAYHYWVAENIQHVITRGLESHLYIKAAFSGFGFSLSGNYTYTRTTSEKDDVLRPRIDNRQLTYIPVHSGNGALSFVYGDYFINYNLEYTGARLTQTGDEITDYEIILNPFLLSDVVAGTDVRILNQEFFIQIAARNLFDREYQMIYCRPMPGRNYSISIGYKF